MHDSDMFTLESSILNKCVITDKSKHWSLKNKQRKSVAWTTSGNQRKKLVIHKLSQISCGFSREIGQSLRSTFKCSQVGLPPISKHLEVC